MIASIRLVVVLIAVFAFTFIAIPAQAVMLRYSKRAASKFPTIWHRTVLKMFGIKVTIHGNPSDDHPLLLVSNHASWKDILVLGSVKPLTFVAKADMSSWPLLGRLAKLQRTIFVDRDQRSKAGAQAIEIAERMSQGDIIVLFAEGTTSDGNKVLPFKSSLLGAAQLAIKQSDQERVAIQPVAIAYTRMHGVALGRFYRPEAAWPGDVGLAGHVINIVKQGALDVDLHFGDPIPFSAGSDRKIVTREIEEQVRQMLHLSLRGAKSSTAATDNADEVVKSR